MTCVVCGCSEEGSTNLICDKRNGQCTCKPNVINRQCDECDIGYKSFPDCIRKLFHIMKQLKKDFHFKILISACECDIDGSTGISCSDSGQCACKENIEGVPCDRCTVNHYDFPNCYGMFAFSFGQ